MNKPSAQSAASLNKNSRKIFIGVAWPYVNGDLHVGHLAGYLVPADITARFHRMRGNEVLMVSGSDCYGTPITVEADKRGISPDALVDEYHPKIVELFRQVDLSFDNYSRTMNPNHHAVVQDFFLGLINKGYIFRDKSEQYYSEQEKRFLPDRYVEGTCPHCGYTQARSDQCDGCGSPMSGGELINPVSRNTRTPVTLKPTEHYFLDWPKLQSFLEKYVDANSPNWRSWVVSETKKWLGEGLKPRAITRDLNWGVPIPADRLSADKLIDGHEGKRIYVWFEAVIGYYSASIDWANLAPGREWQPFWKNADAKHYYFMGKDNLVFHTLFWPGQLHGFDPSLHLPDQPAINHFLTSEGQKFSKSRGVFVDPLELIKEYGLEAVRFYVAFLSPETMDADFTYDGLKTVNNSILSAKIGNFVHRSLTLGGALNYAEHATVSADIIAEVERAAQDARQALENSEIRRYVTSVIQLSEFANKYISIKQPWDLKKPTSAAFNLDSFAAVMTDCIYMVAALGLLIKPLLPDTTRKIESMLGVKLDSWPESVTELLTSELAKVKVHDPQPLFKRIEAKAAEESKA